MNATFTIAPRGSFSLRESVEFGFGQRPAQRYAGSMGLAFVVDGTDQQVGVVVREDADGVHGEVVGDGGRPDSGRGPSAGGGDAFVASVRAQVARVLSLDVDATGFDALGAVDPVLARVQQVAHGLRPPLFYSPYEATVWSVLSARRPAAQMEVVRERFSRAHGRVFSLAGDELAALPTPDQLLAVDAFPGIPAEKLTRMRDVARAAKDGWLDVERLRRLGPEVATAELQRIKGIGPFYASLVVIRAVGFTDVLPREEPKLRDLVGRLYGLPGPAGVQELERIAEPWRPFRTWASVMIRAAGARVAAMD